jgi:HAD superfamily hydrolase (TIGR01509 family)
LQKIKAVTFDMDGLLLDTERIALGTFVNACQDFGIQPDLQVYYRCIGTTENRTGEILRNRYGKTCPMGPIINLWRKKFSEVTKSDVPLKEGARHLLLFLQREGVKKVVVTSTRLVNAKILLTKVDILSFFDTIIGGDQVANGKPHPEIYLTACRELGEEPSSCLALEDSDNGVLSALSAGLQVIQVPDLVEPSAEIKEYGHKIVQSLIEVEKILRNLQSDMCPAPASQMAEALF